METRVEVLGRNLKEAGFLLEEELSHDYGKKRNMARKMILGHMAWA